MSFYDADAPDKGAVEVMKTVNITGLCSRASSQHIDIVILKYGKVTKGPVVEVETWRLGGDQRVAFCLTE